MLVHSAIGNDEYIFNTLLQLRKECKTEYTKSSIRTGFVVTVLLMLLIKPQIKYIPIKVCCACAFPPMRGEHECG